MKRARGWTKGRVNGWARWVGGDGWMEWAADWLGEWANAWAPGPEGGRLTARSGEIQTH